MNPNIYMASWPPCGSMYASRLWCSWPPQMESREKSREDHLSLAIECHDDDTVLTLLKRWSEKGQLARLKTDCVSDDSSFCL